MKELGNIGQRVEMFLELALRDEEEHHQVDGLIVQGVEIDALLGAAEGADDFVDQVGGGVRDADAEADAGAHGGLALLDDGGDGFAVLGLDFAGGDEIADQFVDGFPAVGRLQFRQNIVGSENIAQVHSVIRNPVISPEPGG